MRELSRWRYDNKDFVKIREFLNIPGRPPLVSMTTFEHGIPLNSPGYYNNPDDYDCKTDEIEDNCLILHDLLADTAKGKVAGPFRRTPGTHYTMVSCPTGNMYKVPLFFANRFCTHKSKRLQTK